MTPSLARLVDPHASAAPTRPALVHEGRVITYGDLARGRDALAGRMAEARLGGERVALMLPNGPTTVLAYLACFASGAVAAPLNARYAPPEVERALRHLRPRWLIVQDTRLPLLAQVDPAALAGVRVLVAGHADGRSSRSPRCSRAMRRGRCPRPRPTSPR